MATAVAVSSSTGVWNRSSRGSTSSTSSRLLRRWTEAVKPERLITSATLTRTQGMLRTLSRYTGEVYRPMKRHSRSMRPAASNWRTDR
ncbi:hypothetical protein D3C84_1181400 [compost metagenome]